MNSLKTKTCKAALIADFISHFLCCNIMCSAQDCSLCHNFPARHKEWKYNNKPEGRLCVFFPGICTITALPTNYLTAPPNPGYMTSYLRRNKWELCLTRNYVPGWVMRPRRGRHVLKSCNPAFYIMLMSSAEMKGSLSMSMQSSFSAQLFFPLLILQ